MDWLVLSILGYSWRRIHRRRIKRITEAFSGVQHVEHAHFKAVHCIHLGLSSYSSIEQYVVLLVSSFSPFVPVMAYSSEYPSLERRIFPASLRCRPVKLRTCSKHTDCLRVGQSLGFLNVYCELLAHVRGTTRSLFQLPVVSQQKFSWNVLTSRGSPRGPPLVGVF